MFHWSRKHTKDGLEKPDPTPIVVPLDHVKPKSLAEQIARFCNSEDLRLAAEKTGMDSFDEANDFSIEPDIDELPTPYNAQGSPQTRLDEQRGMMVEELPFERLERAEAFLKQPQKEAVNKEPSGIVSSPLGLGGPKNG